MSWLTEVNLKSNHARDIIEGRPIDVLQRQYGSPIPRSSSPIQNEIIRQEIEKPASPYGPPRARDIIMGIRRYDPADEPKYRSKYRERPVTPTQVEYDRVEQIEYNKVNGRYSPPKESVYKQDDYDDLLREKDRRIDFLTRQIEDMKSTYSLGSGSSLELSKYRDEIAYLKRENERLHEENLRLLERLGKNDTSYKITEHKSDEGRVSWVNSFGKESALTSSTNSTQPRRPFLGVEVKAEDHTGQNLLVVHSVISGSPAAVAGIQAGDVIRTWNGKQLASKSHFQRLLNESIGLNVNLGVSRSGKTINLNVIISGTAGAPVKRPSRSRTPP